MTDGEMTIRLHDIARDLETKDPAYAKEMREIGDRFAKLASIVKDLEIYEKAAYHRVIQG